MWQLLRQVISWSIISTSYEKASTMAGSFRNLRNVLQVTPILPKATTSFVLVPSSTPDRTAVILMCSINARHTFSPFGKHALNLFESLSMALRSDYVCIHIRIRGRVSAPIDDLKVAVCDHDLIQAHCPPNCTYRFRRTFRSLQLWPAMAHYSSVDHSETEAR